MFLTKENKDYYIIIAGRESDISLRVKHLGSTTITFELKPSVDDQTAHNKEMSPEDAIAVLYKLWNDGELFPSKLLIHLQNDVINHILNKLTYGKDKEK